MIETVGNGIKKIFTIHKERLFPLPTYDISDETHTKVTVYGELIDENYTNILNDNPELPLEDVIALDKVQKKQFVSETETARLRELKLVKGRATTLQIIGNVKLVNSVKLDNNVKNIPNKELKQHILDLLRKQGIATRIDIEKLIMPHLPTELPIENKRKKISNIVSELSYKEKQIVNTSSSTKNPVWKLVD
jgi:ATP-dependent DNA helicase RecG